MEPGFGNPVYQLKHRLVGTIKIPYQDIREECYLYFLLFRSYILYTSVEYKYLANKSGSHDLIIPEYVRYFFFYR